MKNEILLLWPLSFLSPSPLLCESSLLPCLSFGRSISRTVTTATHISKKCQHTCQDSEVCNEIRSGNEYYFLFPYLWQTEQIREILLCVFKLSLFSGHSLKANH